MSSVVPPGCLVRVVWDLIEYTTVVKSSRYECDMKYAFSHERWCSIQY